MKDLCATCGELPATFAYDGLGAGGLPPAAFALRDARGQAPDPGRDGTTALTCPTCGQGYSLRCDVGGGEWFVELTRTLR